MGQAKFLYHKWNSIIILFIIFLSVTTFSFAQDKTVVIPLFDSPATQQEVSFCVKRNSSYDWPVNGVFQIIDFSSNSTLWYNNGGGFSGNEFQAPASGVYTFNGTITFSKLEVGDTIGARIVAGGKGYLGPRKLATVTSERVHITITVHMNAGEFAKLGGIVSAASPPASVSGGAGDYAYTYFMGAKVF